MDNQTLKKLTGVLLSETAQIGDLHKAVHALHDLFADAAGIAAGDVTDDPIYLASGKAISPIQAVHCLLEFKRTAVFIRGIYKAILHLQQVFGGKRINILYAGCGPYATLLTPLTTLFSPDEINFILLDINSICLDAAGKLYEHLKLTAYVKKHVLADASVYRIEEEDEIHLIVSETMQHALKKEPQVAIMLNLIPQLPAGGIFIPEEISVNAKLTSGREESLGLTEEDKVPERIDLGMVYSIGTQRAKPHKTVTFNLPKDTGSHNSLNLFTDIKVYKNDILTTNDCSLNLPLRLCEIDIIKEKQVSFTYQMTDKPHFAWQFIR